MSLDKYSTCHLTSYLPGAWQNVRATCQLHTPRAHPEKAADGAACKVGRQNKAGRHKCEGIDQCLDAHSFKSAAIRFLDVHFVSVL